MQQEDDLRGLAKVMQFMRALSLLFALIHFYWYAYSWITAVGWNTALADKILMNFQRMPNSECPFRPSANGKRRLPIPILS
mgnify:CR=1 FL=1